MNPMKTDHSHTPGPWVAQKDIRHSTNTRVLSPGPLWWAVYGATRLLCMEEASAWLTEAEQEANARLIAAAPELLEIATRLSRLCPSNEGLGGHAPIGAFIQLGEAARAAIAKAKGTK